MGSFYYRTKNKRERLLDSLCLGSRQCPECEVVGLYLKERSFDSVSCFHCEGKWSVGEDKHTLTRLTFDNIKPLYLEEGA